MQRWIVVFLMAWPSWLPADMAAEVGCRETGFSLAAEARDAVRFASFIDEDARFVGQSVVRGRNAVVEAWGAFFDPDGPAIAWRPQFVEVLEEDGLALTRGPYRLRVATADGAVQESWGTFNSTWRRNADGEWRVVFDAGSPPGQPPGEAVRALLDQPVDCLPAETP